MDKVKCAWCGDAIKIKPGIIETERNKGICKQCLLHNFPCIYQLIYGDQEVHHVGKVS